MFGLSGATELDGTTDPKRMHANIKSQVFRWSAMRKSYHRRGNPETLSLACSGLAPDQEGGAPTLSDNGPFSPQPEVRHRSWVAGHGCTMGAT